MTGAQVSRRHGCRDGRIWTDFYFESAAMILTLITVGKTLEAALEGKDDRMRSRDL